MSQVFTDEDVYTAARRRLGVVFDDFEYVYVSFSGGKDSGVLLNLALNEAARRKRRIGVFHIDYEAQYQQTTDYVARMLEAVRGAGHDVYHVCLPISAQCATSMFQDSWTPWDDEKRALWVRDMPHGSIHEGNAPAWFTPGMWDYDLQERIGPWLAQTLGKTVCCLVGIRAQESLNRWRTIAGGGRKYMHAGFPWTKTMGPNAVNAYPIYDWQTEDIWTANARFGWDYNRLYDLFYQAGVPLGAMRVASPFNDAAGASLHLYRAIDPNTWGKMVGRVNGVNFTGIYGGTDAVAWKNIKLPAGHTWRSYVEFLLRTLPEDTRRTYEEKFSTSIEFWRSRGGVLSRETIAELQAMGVQLQVRGKTNYATDKEAVTFAEYPDDADVKDFATVPSYKRMAICILKNDHLCKYMGFSQTKREAERRRAAIEKYSDL